MLMIMAIFGLGAIEEILVFMWRNVASLCSLFLGVVVISFFAFVEEDIQNTVIIQISSLCDIAYDLSYQCCDG